MKKTRQRLDDLEDQLISHPTILHMPKGKKVMISGPRNYLLSLATVCTNRKNATKEQVKQLDLRATSVRWSDYSVGVPKNSRCLVRRSPTIMARLD